MLVFELSAKTGEGMAEFFDFLQSRQKASAPGDQSERIESGSYNETDQLD
jgi:hypothetical protein